MDYRDLFNIGWIINRYVPDVRTEILITSTVSIL